MNIRIQTKSGVPIYEQIKKQLGDLILGGVLGEAEALPSIRSLAGDLKISVITTKRAYEDLEKEGLIYSVPGKGFYVDNPDKEYLQEKKVYGLEEELAGLLDTCRQSGLSKEEVKELVDLLWQEA
ncbi:MAG: GntR family transcriptional regulator [Lachnospiraceae bacterium]|nr:GntR family transcriptional regulator [Lachnospiraceae bacterium]